MARIQFHLDHNVATAVAAGLRQRGIDVTFAWEVHLETATDETHLEFALRENRVLVTHDSDFLALANRFPHAGIAYCHQNKLKVGELIDVLIRLVDRSTAEEMHGWIEYLKSRPPHC